MSRLSLPLSLVLSLVLVRLIEAQCVTTGYVPCYPAGGGSAGSDGVPDIDLDNSEYWDTLQNVANLPIGKRTAPRHLLAPRQNALCCDPSNQCLVLTDGDIPFCYDSDTTRFVFSDSSFGYFGNGTYYAADGSFVDFQDGYYSSADGTTGTFAPATATASSSGMGAAATTSTTAHAGTKTTASPLANQSPTASTSAGTTQQGSATAPASTVNVKSGGETVMPASVISWLGLCVAGFGVFLA